MDWDELIAQLDVPNNEPVNPDDALIIDPVIALPLTFNDPVIMNAFSLPSYLKKFKYLLLLQPSNKYEVWTKPGKPALVYPTDLIDELAPCPPCLKVIENDWVGIGLLADPDVVFPPIANKSKSIILDPVLTSVRILNKGVLDNDWV